MTENSKSCVRARPGAEQDNINYVAYGTWTVDFMSQQNESSAFLGKYLKDPRRGVPSRHKRQEMMAIAWIIPVGKWLAKMKRRSYVVSRSCKRAREQHGASTEILPEVDGMATTVTACLPTTSSKDDDDCHLYASMQAAQTPASKLRAVTPDKESSTSMNTLRQDEEFEQICSRESISEKAAEIKKTMSVKTPRAGVGKRLLILRSSVRLRLNPENSNSDGPWI